MILITGPTGTSGGEIVRQLAATGTRFRALVRNPQKAQSLKSPQVELVAGDLADGGSLASALSGVDRLLMLAPPAPNAHELEMNLLEAAKKAGIRHIIKFSAMTADPASKARFPRSHGQTEQQIRASGIAWTFLRPTFFMQNLLGLADMVRGGTIYQPAADSKAAFVDTRDIAAVAVKALTEAGHEGKAYDITGPELLSYTDVARIFSERLGKAVNYHDIPPAAANDAMLKMGIPQWNVDGILELMDQMRAGEYARVTQVVHDVARRQPITLAQFVDVNRAAFGG